MHVSVKLDTKGQMVQTMFRKKSVQTLIILQHRSKGLLTVMIDY